MVSTKLTEYQEVQGIVGEQSFSIVLPKKFAIDLGIGKGDFVRVHKQGDRIVVEKAPGYEGEEE
jgi:antitoxin component of MazEF toxin-antitoxin module